VTSGHQSIQKAGRSFFEKFSTEGGTVLAKFYDGHVDGHDGHADGHV
jgi:hypothetical protein